MPPGESVSASLIRRSDLPESGMVSIQALIGGENVAIIVQTAGERVRAWRNACPHEGRRLDYAPGKFLLDGARLVCPAHGASFRLEDGFCVSGPCRGESLQAIEVECLPDGMLRFQVPR